MSATLKVSVTAPLIERATQRDSRHCMIAEAITAARPNFRNVIVDLATIRWTNPRTGKRYVALTPEPAAVALVAFDQGREVKAFDLALRPIQVTNIKRTTETRAEARTAGRKSPAQNQKRAPRKISIDAKGQPTIEGGKPLPTGHLSNVALSGRRYRAYGLRQLAE
jgi:hypothetical protein